jgi:hypothetical protein
MRLLALLLVLLLFKASYAQLSDDVIRDLKSGRVKNDTSYIYNLPYAVGDKHLLIQAYNSKMSHKSELSLDFKMKIGSAVCAARAGVVIAIKKDSDVSGLKEEYLSQGNNVIILHNDGSKAMYWHFKKEGVLVNVDDRVEKGQLIGYSGNTGYTAFPHLHFQVEDKNGREIATRFLTKQGIIYLRPGKAYKRVL